MSAAPEKQFHFVDVSGVGNAGKSAVVDFLREFPSFHVPAHSFEFDLFRVSGGLVDLHHHLVEDWSPIRSDRAIKEYRALVRRMALSPRWYDIPGKLVSSGQNYDRVFGGKFLQYNEELIEKLVAGELEAYWPYDWLRMTPLTLATNKALMKLGSTRLIRSKVYLSNQNDLSALVTTMMNRLFSELVAPDKTHVVLNNAFEPFNPERSLNLLHHSKSILFYRDPRDVFVSGMNKGNVAAADQALQAKENDGRNKSFLGTDNLETFVVRYRTYMNNLYRGNDPRVLRVRFEDFVVNHDEWRPRILEFLGIDGNDQKRSSHFRPETSSQNIGIWKKFSNAETVRALSHELKDYLWS